MMLAVIISARSTALSLLWLAVITAALLFVLAGVLGTVLRSSRLWGIAIALIAVDLLLGVIAALLNRLGYAR